MSFIFREKALALLLSLEVEQVAEGGHEAPVAVYTFGFTMSVM
jgi:hypothetical protein